MIQLKKICSFDFTPKRKISENKKNFKLCIFKWKYTFTFLELQFFNVQHSIKTKKNYYKNRKILKSLEVIYFRFGWCNEVERFNEQIFKNKVRGSGASQLPENDNNNIIAKQSSIFLILVFSLIIHL